jgi:hypothetical protein
MTIGPGKKERKNDTAGSKLLDTRERQEGPSTTKLFTLII